ncbi:MAG: DEAD/DEAH box helicase [Muribaculaceae bacterium]|nr:DEAD/DEAH box helicase [Muribaculaceae bacterium]
MKTSEIPAHICARTGIKALNPMQAAMLSASSPLTVLIAPTGSGKTIAFAANMLTMLKPPCGRVQAVIEAPSRELVLQTTEVIRRIASGHRTVALYGGHAMIEESRSLSSVPDIIVATPGRLLDHLHRSNLDISHISTLVLDEYDKMLELGFDREMRRIASRTGHPERVLLTSATKLDVLPDYLGSAKPELIESSCTRPASRMSIVQVESPARDKLTTLIDLLKSLPDGKVIIFTGHRESTERVYTALKSAHLPAALYHGGLEQADRQNAVDMLANGSAPILVATDLAARGLDIEGVNAVIHYHMPVSEEAWTHRNGRTARQDASGAIYVITSEADNIPEYIRFSRSYAPTGTSDTPITAHNATLYFASGKKDKISRGDIAGFLIAQCGLAPDEVGMISLRDHSALVAVPAAKARDTAKAANEARIKGKKVRVTQLRR